MHTVSSKCFGLVLSFLQHNAIRKKLLIYGHNFNFFFFIQLRSKGKKRKKPSEKTNLSFFGVQGRCCVFQHTLSFFLDFMQKFAINFILFLLLSSFDFAPGIFPAFKFGLWRKANCNRLSIKKKFRKKMSSVVVNFFPIGFPAIHVVYAANFLPLVSSHRSRNFNQWLICLNTTKTLFLPFKIQTHANKSVQKSLFSFRLPAALVMTNSTSFYFGDWESLCFNINMYTQSSTQSISNSDKHWHFVQENPSKFRYACYSLHELNFSIEILPMDLLNRECSYVRRNTTKNRYNKTEARKKRSELTWRPQPIQTFQTMQMYYDSDSVVPKNEHQASLNIPEK